MLDLEFIKHFAESLYVQVSKKKIDALEMILTENGSEVAELVIPGWWEKPPRSGVSQNLHTEAPVSLDSTSS